MKNIWKKHKAPLIIFGYIIIVASFIYFIFIPSVNKIREKSDMIQEKNIDSQMRQASLAAVPEMEAEYNNFLDNQDATDVILNSRDEVVFIKKLETLAAQTGNAINLQIDDPTAANGGTANQPGGAAAKSGRKTIKDTLSYNKYVSMQIEIKGSYPSFLNFLNKLENDSYYVNVLSVNMQKETVAPDNTVPVDVSSGNNIFSAGNQNGQQKPAAASEILDSTLSVVVYIKN